MKTVVLVGAGGRARAMFALPFVHELKGSVHFGGIYDPNTSRAKALSEECEGVPIFDDFDTMLHSVRPDTAVVASSDSTHHTYIIAAMEAGCDVISEKPMTVDAEKCREILDTEKRTGRSLKVTFNMRYVPYVAKIKELLLQRVIGDVHHVALEWFLDRSHGADYFRRWHGQMEYSGGLLVHKSTHHFDMVNWLLDRHPEEVHAFGKRVFYGPTREKRGHRCLTCEHKSDCEFYFDISKNEFVNRYYLQAEQEDGYYRDQCVFGERINIYDTMSVHVQYAGGPLLTYSLVAFSPVEGWKATLQGSSGRMEISDQHQEQDSALKIRITRPSGETEEHRVPIAAGGHGGSDERLRRMLFVGDVADPLGQQAGSLSGAMSLLIGAAANVSIAEGKPVSISELLAPSIRRQPDGVRAI
ncbi:Gfo/Idh/MocA family protein [Paenibacillus sp. MBLB4367]|uniref:Gfo/Idh/MocA family protein n=1 Tax=Paenibacillus sp. MBLB4367 TaxID=3384767 RepID=UPI0039081E5B